MTIEKRTVFVSPDGQFHESEESAKKYVERGELVKALRAEIVSYLEDSGGDPYSDARGITDMLLSKFNVSLKEA